MSKYVRRRGAIIDERRVRRVESGRPLDFNRTAVVPVPRGGDVDCGSRVHPRKPGQAIDDVGDEVTALLGLRIRWAQERGPYQQDAVSVVTLGSVQETVRADGAQGRGNEKRERQSDLRHDQGAAEALPSCRRPATAVLQGTGNLGARCLQRRDNPEDDSGGQCEQRCEHEEPGVDAHRGPSRHEPDDAGRHRDADRVYGRHRHRERNRNGDTREQRAFAEHLAHEAGAAGAERQADRKVSVPLRAACEQQVCNVGARDEEDEYR